MLPYTSRSRPSRNAGRWSGERHSPTDLPAVPSRPAVHDCCNYDGGNCLALDDGWEPCVCVQSITYSLVCKWFRAAVLPTDKGLCAALLHRGQARPCAECGAMFVPRSNRGKYCDECAANVRRRKKAASERERRRRGHLEAEKPCNQGACGQSSKGD